MTDDQQPVEVSAGKGVVVGDYDTLLQVFAQSPASIASHIRAAHFRGLVDERTRNFVGREFVFKEIDRVLSGAEFPGGYLIIRGEPGIGKTAIAANLVARRAYVHHFNVAADNIRSSRQFLENVCAQLIAHYGLDHPRLPRHAGEDSGFLSQLLSEAVSKARKRSEPVVVVVDALDEAEDTELAHSANLLYLPRSLPAGVFFIVTAREVDDFRLNVDTECPPIWIREEDPDNQQDVVRYVERFVEEHSESMRSRIAEWNKTPEAFVETIATLSEGNFMYLVYVLPAIARGELKDGGDPIRGLPRGLKGYYQRHWRDMKDVDKNRFENVQRPVLCFLAISREPVTIRQLSEWAKLEPGDVQAVVREWREFLNEDEEASPSTWRIYHRSFAEFLDAEESLRWYHDRIAERALKKIPGFLEG